MISKKPGIDYIFFINNIIIYLDDLKADQATTIERDRKKKRQEKTLNKKKKLHVTEEYNSQDHRFTHTHSFVSPFEGSPGRGLSNR